jgi:hypothetical protein
MSSAGSVPRVMLAGIVSVTLLATLLATPGRGQTQPPDECAQPVPIDEVEVGMTGQGLTVERGTEPASFRAEVLGVLDDGISAGVDMIIANLQSPAVDGNGVWAGMSGSPVYTDDGRLLGAVAYTLAGSPTTIAGITPADAMLALYEYPGAAAGQRMSDEVPLPAAVQRRAVAESDATTAQARQGMSALPLPLAVSGVRPGRMDEFGKQLAEGGALRPFAANRAAPSGASAGAIVPGGNFAAAVSYGDVTLAGVGTTTDVCRGTALAFGHPMLHDGGVALSAHSADAIVVQPDPYWGGAFKVANVGGVVGTVDQDRLLGLRAPLGDAPRATTVQSRIASTTLDRERTGRTWVNYPEMVSTIAASHVLDNLDRVMDTFVDGGRVQLTWTARGTRANGSPWTVTRSDRFAHEADVTFEAAGAMLEWLDIIRSNQFADVTIDDIDVTGTVDETFQRLRFGDVRVAVNGGAYRQIGAIDRLRVGAGDTIRVRVPLIRYQQETPSRTVNLRMAVPERLAGRSVRLAVVGGANLRGEVDANVRGATSFADLVARMNRQHSSNDVVARLQVSGDSGPQVLTKTETAVANVVGGRRSVGVAVAR